MSEPIPGYGVRPDLPLIDVRLLRSNIAMYLRSGAGESAARKLLEESNLALARLGRALYELERKVS